MTIYRSVLDCELTVKPSDMELGPT